jgi:hypothetical protein
MARNDEFLTADVANDAENHGLDPGAIGSLRQTRQGVSAARVKMSS